MSLEQKLREQSIDVKTICFGERTVRKIMLREGQSDLLRKLEQMEVVAYPLIEKELGVVVDFIDAEIRELESEELKKKTFEVWQREYTGHMMVKRKLEWVKALLVEDAEERVKDSEVEKK